jgi:hypothetical protein
MIQISPLLVDAAILPSGNTATPPTSSFTSSGMAIVFNE